MILCRNKQLGFLVAFLLICCCISGFAQSSSNQGKEFWTGYMAHVEDNGQSQMALYITSDFNTSGVVDIADNSFAPITFQVTAKEVTIVAIPRSAFLQIQGQFNKGIHITAQKKIAVYAHIYAQSVSGATLLLPVSVLSRSYYSINYTQQSNSIARPSYSTFMVIATEDNTTVEINPSQFLADGKPAGTPFTVSLKKGEVYQGLSNEDLTYTTIRSVSSANGECKKIAVFSGSSKIGIGCARTAFTSDNLFQQVYPTASWGKNYITVPLKNRNYDVFRVILSDPATKITVNGVGVVADKISGPLSYYEFQSQNANVISADKPIQVVQYAVSQGNVIGDVCQVRAGDIGDPEMIYLTPLEQTLDHVTLYSPTSFNIENSYVNVVIKTDIASTFLVDGEHRGDFAPIPSDPTYSYAQVNVFSGTSYLSAAGGFNAIAYGFGRTESYGFAAGTNLQNLNEFIAFSPSVGGIPLVNGCSGVEYKLQLTIPYPTNRIKWDFKDGSAIFVDDNPVLKSTVVKGDKTLYTYEYDFKNVGCVGRPVTIADKSTSPDGAIIQWIWDFGDGSVETRTDNAPFEHTYTQTGAYPVKLTVVNINGCTGEFVKTFNVSKLPVVDFSVPDVCLADAFAQFFDKSTIGDNAEQFFNYSWNFGDARATAANPNTSTQKDPKHKYTQAGVYTVSLTVTSGNGCPEVKTIQFTVNGSTPKAQFTVQNANNLCSADEVVIQDQSTVDFGNITKLVIYFDFANHPEQFEMFDRTTMSQMANIAMCIR